MIKLSWKIEKDSESIPIYVKEDAILVVRRLYGEHALTEIQVVNRVYYTVTETPEEIIQMVSEKL